METTQSTRPKNTGRKSKTFTWHIKVEPIRQPDIDRIEAIDGTSSNDGGCSMKPIEGNGIHFPTV